MRLAWKYCVSIIVTEESFPQRHICKLAICGGGGSFQKGFYEETKRHHAITINCMTLNANNNLKIVES